MERLHMGFQFFLLAKLRVFAAVCLILTSGAFAGEHQAISVDDVLAGIESRRSQIHDIELDVSYRSETTKEGWALQQELELRLHHPAVFEGKTMYDLWHEHIVLVNASRGFWPVEIRDFRVVDNFHESFHNPGMQPGQKILQNVVVVEELVEDNGCFYPRRIRRDRYIPKDVTYTELVLFKRETLDFPKVSINSGIPQSRFELEFPPGTQFRKPGDPRVYFVNPDGTIRDLTGEMRHSNEK